MSNLQLAIVLFLAVVAIGTLALMLVAGGNQRTRQEQDDEDADQIAAVSQPAPLLWNGAQTTQRRRAGQID